MKLKHIKNILLTGVLLLLVSSCQKDLNRKPFYDVTSASVYTDFNNYKQVLAKCYAGYALTGQAAGDGNADLGGVDVGYLRGYWQVQELSTDEAVIAWNDQYLIPLDIDQWTSANQLLGAMYDRIFLEVGLCNEFLRETTDAKLKANGITDPGNLAQVKIYRAETRFLRALAYSHGIDLFGSIPLVTENDPVGAFLPKQVSRKDLFAYVESELKAIDPDLVDARKNEYARADKGAEWTLLAKLYLNAKVYTGTDRYADAITYCNKVIGAGYTLEPKFENLFMADNDHSNEIIFTIAYDGTREKTYNGTTFLVHAPVGGSMDPKTFGIDGGWYGLRTTKNIVNLFADPSGNTDQRAQFYAPGQSLEINSIANYADGYPITKWKNVTSTGQQGSDPAHVFVDTDYPMFRLGEIYLTYAEATLRGGAGGNISTALGYINKLRERAYGNTSGNITQDKLTLDFMLDERGREMAWEGQRRTDLIRFGKFTGSNYLWPWKGGVQAGTSIEDYRSLYPIPSTDMIANPTLKQNPGY